MPRHTPEYNFTTNPTPNDDDTQGYDIFDRWHNTATGKMFQCVSNATGAAVWSEVCSKTQIETVIFLGT